VHTAFVQVEIAEFVVADAMGKHVIDSHQDLMGYPHRRALVSTPGFESVKFVSQVSAMPCGAPKGAWRLP
jgi:hypothetical protein